MFVVFRQLLPGDAEYNEKKSKKFPKAHRYQDRVYPRPEYFCDNLDDAIKELKKYYGWFVADYKPIMAGDTTCFIDDNEPINSYAILHHEGYRTPPRAQSVSGFARIVWAGREYPKRNEKLSIKQFSDAIELLNIRENIISRIKDVLDKKGYEAVKTRENYGVYGVPSYDFDHYPVTIVIRKKGDVVENARVFVFYPDKEFKTPCIKLDMGGQIPLLPKEIAGYSTTWYENLPSKRKNYLANEANINKLVEILEKKL